MERHQGFEDLTIVPNEIQQVVPFIQNTYEAVPGV